MSVIHTMYCTVEPSSKGHFETSHFVPCREVVLFLEVENVLIAHVYTFGDIRSVLCREVVPFLEGSLLEVLHCIHTIQTLLSSFVYSL